jgi:hypothetical protein
MLDDLPVASIVFIASLVLIVIGYIGDDIGFEEAFEALAAAGVGSGAIGFVRNQAGRGIRR